MQIFHLLWLFHMMLIANVYYSSCHTKNQTAATTGVRCIIGQDGWSDHTLLMCCPVTSCLLFLCVRDRCFGEDTCLSIPDIKAVVMVLPPSEPRITIAGSNRLVRPAGDLRGPMGVAPFKELHITSTVMKGDSFGGCECKSGCLGIFHLVLLYNTR